MNPSKTSGPDTAGEDFQNRRCSFLQNKITVAAPLRHIREVELRQFVIFYEIKLACVLIVFTCNGAGAADSNGGNGRDAQFGKGTFELYVKIRESKMLLK